MTNITKSYGIHCDTIHVNSVASKSTMYQYGKSHDVIFEQISGKPKTSKPEQETKQMLTFDNECFLKHKMACSATTVHLGEKHETIIPRLDPERLGFI